MRLVHVVAAVALLVALLSAITASAQSTTQPPSEHELEVWRAVSRLDTPDAYREYLRAFPEGSYATLARMALEKLSGASGAREQSDGVATSQSPLKPFAGALNTGSISIKPGDTMVGPGVISIGWVGAKKQLVLPRGTWTLLAAEDHAALDGRAQATTMAFGQFNRSNLRSLLLATFNRFGVPSRSPITVSQSTQGGSWPTCGNAPSSSLFREAGKRQRLQYCAVSLLTTDARQREPIAPQVQHAIDAALAQMGATKSAFHVRSEVHITDWDSGYLGYTRFDCVEAAAAGAACADELSASSLATARGRWLETYLPFVLDGYGRNHHVHDLEPGKPDNSGVFLNLPF